VGRTIYLELVESSRIASDLSAGGLMVQDKSMALQDTCELVVFNDGGQLELEAKAVYVDGNGGVGLELVGFDADLKAKIAELIIAGTAAAAAAAAVGEPGEPTAEAPATPRTATAETPTTPRTVTAEAPATSRTATAEAPATSRTATAEAFISQVEAALVGVDAGDAPVAADEAPPMEVHSTDEDERQPPKNLHERLRGLTLVEQHKRAKEGDVTERTLLERMYGKNVWETLLRNPRLTAPEVARIARMGALPRPMIELIVGNGTWLQVPEVRRALLSNPRLGTDQILRILRLMAKHELKVAAATTAYPYGVRDAAKRLLKTEGG